jgi:Na+/H+ antiporter NhaD/arsenite permease-like protein
LPTNTVKNKKYIVKYKAINIYKRENVMKRIYNYLKKDAVLTISWVLAIISMLFIKPDKAYAGYIDWRSLGILWSLMIITKGYMQNGIFEKIGHALLARTRKMWQLIAVLVGLNFFSSMIITNDVSLITFVPFAIMMLKQCGRQELMIPVVVLQTIAANLGSMLTPIGNPQNLYLHGLAGTGIGEFIMWLLPYTIASALLLVISILLIKNKNEIICIEDTDSEAAHNTSVPRVMAYSVLFVLALLVVARVLTWYILAAAVLITVLLLEKNVLAKADYALLLTFIGFFIFTGNMGRVEPVAHFLAGIVNGWELEAGIITSQCISNVPAALLLSEFTDNIKNLAIGVNIGGLGTLIASMASLISYKLYANEVPEKKGKYFAVFTVYNIIFLVVLYVFTKLI